MIRASAADPGAPDRRVVAGRHRADVGKRVRAAALAGEADREEAAKPIYTDFEDLMGSEREFDLPGFSPPSDFERFRAKARQFLKANENHIAVYKLRMNEPLTPTDLAELERMLSESGIGDAEDVQKAKETSDGLGLFVRSLDRTRPRSRQRRLWAAFSPEKPCAPTRSSF